MDLSVFRAVGALFIVFIIGVGAVFAAAHSDLHEPVARYLSHRLGRKVTVASVRVTIASPLIIELRGVSLANIKDAVEPDMAALAHARAEIAPLSILFGPLVIQRLSIDGMEVLLEHGPGGRPNWKFASSVSNVGANRGNRRVMPALLDGHFHNIEIDVRTSSGNLLRSRLNDIAVTTASADTPVSIKGNGSYNDIPVLVDIALPPFSIAANRAKFPVSFTLRSGTTSLAFEGTATDPLDADGLQGRLVLDSPKPSEVFALAGYTGQSNLPLVLAGQFSRNDTLWRLANGEGTLDGDKLKANIEMREGARHQPDSISLDMAFGHLDLDTLMLTDESKQPAGKMSLLVDSNPGVLLDAHIVAGHIVYRTIEADAFDLKAKTAPSVVSVDQIAANIAGGSAKSRVTISRQGDSGNVDFDGSLTDVDVTKLAKLMGWGTLPISGPVNSHVTGNMAGATLADARGTNRIFAVLSMADGTMDRQLIGMASTDVRSLFGGRRGLSTLSCLLAVLNLRDGLGTIAPVRIKTSDGTIAGAGTYDARRDVVDLTIGTLSATTSAFALDIPVRVSGPVSNFIVRPAFGASRTLAASGDISALPVELQNLVTTNPCSAR